MKKTAALFVTDSFHVGGATAFMEQHYRAMIKLGYAVVIVGAKGDLNDPASIFPQAHLLELPVFQGYGNIIGRLRWFSRTVRAIYSVYRTYNIMLFYSPLSRAYIVGMCCPATWFVPRVYAFCGDVALELQSAAMHPKSWYTKMQTWRHRLIQSIVIVSASRILTFSQYAKKLLYVHYPLLNKESVTVIPGYISVRKHRHVNSKTLSLLTVCRFEPRKGVDSILRAAALLKAAGVDFRLTIAGSFESMYSTDFLELYEKLNLFTDVHIIHKVSHAQLNYLLDQADICVVPSKDLETFGMMTISALARGVPVVGTPTGATPEILGPIEKKLIAKSIAPSDIAKSIQWFKSQSVKKRELLRNKIFTSMESRYDKKIIAKDIERFFLDTVLTPTAK
ncbi:glycosyltransferase family 4 protein [Candidatus Woesebacteria bacterium]|nr:glycosyltransferase family 4 protein [Candidatus Woesebacteria bacterium]